MNDLSLKWPFYSEEEIEAVANVLRLGKVNYWTGEECKVFEKEYADFSDCQYAIALANGTVAIDTALKALGIGPGDEVITTPRTFIATVSCIVNVGAIPVFADVDLNSQNITAQSISKVITKKTKAVIVVHLAGYPAEMNPIMDLCESHKLFVIEDCAQAHGAKYRGKSVGSIGHIGTWSFCQDKIISTGGEGGMVTTNNEELWLKMWSYKDHGKSYSSVYKKKHPVGFKWVHDSFGTNYRMTEIQAAIGRIQLKKIPQRLQVRRQNSHLIYSKLKALDIFKEPKIYSHIIHAYYRFYLFLNKRAINLKYDVKNIVHLLIEQNILCDQGICPMVYKEKSFVNSKIRVLSKLKNIEYLKDKAVCFQVHPFVLKENIYSFNQKKFTEKLFGMTI